MDKYCNPGCKTPGEGTKSGGVLDILKVGMLVVSAVVGAGFASGKEIAVFFARFGYAAYPCAVLCGMLFFAAAAAVARASALIKPDSIEDYNRALFGRRVGTAADILTLFNFLIVAAAMIAAVDSLMKFYGFNTPAFSVVTAALCFAAALGGTKGLLNLNLILMPILIAVIIIVGFGGAAVLRYEHSMSYLSAPHKLIGNAISYVSLNTLLSSGVLVKVRVPYRSYIKGIALGSIVITVLMLAVIAGIISGGLTAINADMPMMVLAGAVNMSVPVGVVVWVGIFTSMAASVMAVSDWASGFCKSRVISSLLVVVAAYLASRMGFRQIVEMVFPVSGIFGIVFVAASGIFCLRDGRKGCANQFVKAN